MMQIATTRLHWWLTAKLPDDIASYALINGKLRFLLSVVISNNAMIFHYVTEDGKIGTSAPVELNLKEHIIIVGENLNDLPLGEIRFIQR